VSVAKTAAAALDGRAVLCATLGKRGRIVEGPGKCNRLRGNPSRARGLASVMADRDSPVIAERPAQAAESPADSHPVRRTGRAVTTPLAAGIAIVSTIIGLIVLAWAILYITKGRFLKHPFERIVGSMTHRDVRVAGDFQLYFDPIDVKFYAEGLTVSNPAWLNNGRNFFEAKTIDSRIATFTLIFQPRRVNWLALDGGHADLEWDAAHQRNSWTFSDQPGKPFQLPIIGHGTVTGTEVRYRDPKALIATDIGIDTVNATGKEIDNAIRFHGDGVARGNRFSLNGALLSPNQTIAGGENKLQLHVSAARTEADVSGTLRRATDIEGANLHVDVRGHNLADAFSLAGIAVPETRPYRLTAALTKTGDEYRFTGLKGRYGDSDIAGKLTVALTKPRMKVTADLASRSVSIADIGPWVGYNPDAIQAKGKGAVVKQVNGTPRLLPDAPLRVEALKAFDAEVKYNVTTIAGKDIPVSNVGLVLSLENSLLKLSPLTFDLARGHLDSDIVIDARRNPVFTDYDIRLAPTPMGRLLAGFGVDESGTSGVLKARIKMTGTGNTVHDSLSSANGRIAVIMPKGSFWTRNVQLSEIDVGTFVQKMFEHRLKEPVQINCGLVAFTVRDGIAAADPILIDTQKNVMLGRGGFSFKNESLDLAFRADGKKFSLFSGQSPVGIKGYFAKPGIDVISPQLVGRAGAAVGLGVVATPLASVLAFVDIGDAKAADCGPVLAGATARQQLTTKGKPRDDVGKGTTAKSEDGKQSPDARKEQRKKFLGIF
jgi:AsmA family protein